MIVELYKVYDKEHREIGNITLMNEFEYFCFEGKVSEQVKAIYLKFELYSHEWTIYRIKETFFKKNQNKSDVKEIANIIGYFTEHYLRSRGRYIVGSEKYALSLKNICEEVRKSNRG